MLKLMYSLCIISNVSITTLIKRKFIKTSMGINIAQAESNKPPNNNVVKTFKYFILITSVE